MKKILALTVFFCFSGISFYAVASYSPPVANPNFNSQSQYVYYWHSTTGDDISIIVVKTDQDYQVANYGSGIVDFYPDYGPKIGRSANGSGIENGGSWDWYIYSNNTWSKFNPGNFYPINNYDSLDSQIACSTDLHTSYPGFSFQGSYRSYPSVILATNYIPAVTTEIPHFRYPVDYTPENPSNWSHRIQSYGSLNNSGGVPHAAEDWNQTTGGCTDAGEPLYSIANGTVIDITSGSSTDGWGKTILIQHDAPEGKYFLTGTGQMLSTVYSLYAHMLKTGQYYDEYLQDIYSSNMDIQQQESTNIDIGDPIGQVGDGDGQWACHLHFAVLTNENLVSTYRNQDPYSWSALSNFTDPSELVNNGLYSDQSTSFTIVVHPYECSNTFQLNDITPNCNGSSGTIGNWTRRKGEQAPGTPELGYGGIIYSKPASDTGTASWIPNLPRDGQYRVWVYIPDSTTYASSEEAEYVITSNSVSSDPQLVDQNDNHGDWVDIGTYNLYQGDTVVSLEGDTDEISKVIAVDAVKFEYVGSIQ